MTERPSSYRQILRATSIIGVTSAINIVFQIVRVKVLAVLLGPGGMGLFAMYQSILTTATSLAGMGISTSAVRQIAEARGNADEQRISEVLYVFRLLTISLGVIGAAVVLIFRDKIAVWTFADKSYGTMVGWLAIGIFVSVASQSLTSLLQGYRRIGDQARLQVWSGGISTLVAISAIFWLREDGIIIFVVATPVIIMLLGYLYVRRIGLVAKRITFQPFSSETRRLIGLGFMVMVAGVLQGLALLTLRSEITRSYGIQATGLFQAAWGLSFVYVGFALDAMGKDYYPHLTENISDKEKTVQLIREQINVVLVLMGPLIIGMIAFAPLLVDFLYAKEFRDAVPLIQWMGIGNLLKVVSWPLGYVLLAQSRSGLFLCLEVAWLAIFLGTAWLLRAPLGLAAVGVAFFVAYLLHLVLLTFACRAHTNFRFDATGLSLLLVSVTLVSVVFIAASYSLPAGYTIGGFAAGVSLLSTYKKLRKMLGRNSN